MATAKIRPYTSVLSAQIEGILEGKYIPEKLLSKDFPPPLSWETGKLE